MKKHISDGRVHAEHMARRCMPKNGFLYGFLRIPAMRNWQMNHLIPRNLQLQDRIHIFLSSTNNYRKPGLDHSRAIEKMNVQCSMKKSEEFVF